jgi:uncharacterized protein
MLYSPPRIDLRELNLKGGERTERFVRFETEPIQLGGQRYQVSLNDEGALLEVERLTGGFLVTVSLEGMVFGACQRCLRELALPVSAREQEFVPSRPEEWAPQDLSPFIEDLVVDAPALAREALILALPDKLLCRPDCPGLCPACGTLKGDGSCDCDEPSEYPRWVKLRHLQVRGASEGESPPAS